MEPKGAPGAPAGAVPASAWRGGGIDAGQLVELLRAGEVALLDVRNHDEVRAWPMAGAVHVPLPELPRAPQELPGDRPVVAVCAHGMRSARAAQWLAARGYPAASLRGGMAAWSAAYAPATLEVPGGAVTQLRRLGKGCLTYIAESDGEATVVDPTCHLEAVLQVVRARGLRVKHVADTHRHADHLSGAVELARATGAKLHLSKEDGYDDVAQDPIGAGAQLAVGHRQALVLDAAATPGHTPGSLTFVAEGRLALTGDALFLDGAARPDLRDQPEAYARELHRTYQRIAAWDPKLQVMPAHLSPRWPLDLGQVAARPLGEVRAALDAFRLPEADFVRAILDRLPPRPANYQVIVERNRRGDLPSPDEAEELEYGGNACVVT